MTDVDCVLDAGAEIGEGPVWSVAEQRLYWVDIDAGVLHRFDPASATDQTWQLPEAIGCVALRRGTGLVVALRRGFALFDPGSGALERLTDPEPDKPDNRFNDGTVDPAGRFWAGTMRSKPGDPAADGALYRLDADLHCTRVADGFWTINGLAFSPDGRTLYLSDSNPRVRTIWACDYDVEDGVATNRRVFATTHDLAGRPDGGAVDADGCYWMAGVGGWQLVRFTPAGKVDRIIDMPIAMPTKIAFGGPRLDTLYVTSIGGGGEPERVGRQAGGLFAVHAGVTGIEMPAFAG